MNLNQNNEESQVDSSEQPTTEVAPVVPYDPTPLGQPTSTGASRRPSTCAIMAITFGVLALSCMLLAYGTLQGGLNGLGRLGERCLNHSDCECPEGSGRTCSPERGVRSQRIDSEAAAKAGLK